jgi:hypothetical protein
MDENGKTVSKNFDVIKNSISSRLLGQSNTQLHTINMLENHSFDADDDLSGWIITKGNESIVKTEHGGVYGEKYLLIDKTAGETVSVYQSVARPRKGNSQLKGFIKYQGNDSVVAADNIKIEVRVEYKLLEEVQNPSASSSGSSSTITNKEVKFEKFCVPTMSFVGESDWIPFSIDNISIPT